VFLHLATDCLNIWCDSESDFDSEQKLTLFDISGIGRKTDYWSVLEQPPKGMHIEIVRAAKSDRWTPDIIARMKEAEAKKPDNVSFHVLENAGHWLHTDTYSGQNISIVILAL
jgi:hypothetical protein